MIRAAAAFLTMFAFAVPGLALGTDAPVVRWIGTIPALNDVVGKTLASIKTPEAR
jgi:hypothetical protein